MNKSIDSLDAHFVDLHTRSLDLIARLSPARLYAKPEGSADSFGEQILRSAAVVEQTFGGLTANLWDDPFEWTLPETLNAPAKVREYLNEVEVTRRHAFGSFESDDDLSKQIMTPAGSTQLLPFLLDTLRRARHHHERAEMIHKLLND